MIEGVILSGEQLRANLEIMRKGNSHLKDMARMTGMSLQPFRARLFRRPFDPKDWPELSPEQATLFANHLGTIRAVRDIEMPMLQGFIRLAYGLANHYARLSPRSDRDDFQQEAALALLDAIYSYTLPTADFSTFATVTIRNRLIRLLKETHRPLGLRHGRAAALQARYRQAQSDFNGPASHMDICEAAGFTAEEITAFEQAQVAIVPVGDTERTSDYTGMRDGLCHEGQDGYREACNKEVQEKVARALARANLSPVEMEVVRQLMSGQGRGWQSKLAKSLMRSDVPKTYCRAAIGWTVRRVVAKLRYKLREVA